VTDSNEEGQMHARVSTIEGSSDQVDAGISNFRENVVPFTREGGGKGSLLLADRQAGRVIAITAPAVFAAGGVLGIFAEGTVGFLETELLPFEEGAVAFAAASGVPIVPCAIVGSTFLWFRKPVTFRFGDPIQTDEARGRDGRAALDEEVRAAMRALMPDHEPRLPRRRPLRFLGDLLTGPTDLERRRAELGE